jgi:hypothetical protein
MRGIIAKTRVKLLKKKPEGFEVPFPYFIKVFYLKVLTHVIDAIINTKQIKTRWYKFR